MIGGISLYHNVLYTADGEKLTKAVTGGGATKNYVGGIEYSGANLEAIYHGEGWCTSNGATAFFYEYTVKDHPYLRTGQVWAMPA